jgi:transcriptional regulator with PAS, ATPase and Fis domain
VVLERRGGYLQLKNMAAESRREDANAQLEAQLTLCGLVTRSPELKQLAASALRVARVDSTVLLLGESGVGKGMFAQLICRLGERRNLPLVKIACGAIPDNLMESELFGYESGAFTGARREGKKGLLEQAGEGTVLLDEVGELSPLLQVKLLNVLQDREFTRVGGLKPISTNARILAATNRNLEEAVRQGNFREDLYYRLNVIPLVIPPLRERRSDILPLINHFLQHYCQRYHLTRSISPVAINYLLRYDWPGNVRELQNLIEFLVVMSPETLISEQQLPDKILKSAKRPTALQPVKKKLKDALEEYESNFIRQAIEDHDSLRAAAESLGIDLSTLVRKQQKYRLRKQR